MRARMLLWLRLGTLIMWLVLVLGFLGLLFTGSGCGTLQAQAKADHTSEVAALLHDAGTFAKDEVSCDSGILAQVMVAIYTLNLGVLTPAIDCIPQAAHELEMMVRVGTMPAPAVEHVTLAKGMVQVKAQVAARTKQGP